MKNILNIIRHDIRKVTGSVVAIITIMGLCLVPCSYAWFNILSNWAPYESEATSRIPVAVANMDNGATAAGLALNVGDQIIDGLEGNDQIGWVFVDSDEEAIQGVYASEYYAALIIPEDFTSDVVSFMSGNLENPTLYYYENEKKNAIAPKITGKAKTAVQEQVNATFVETLAKYVSDAASIMEANGLDPSELLSDLSKRAAELSSDLDNAITLSDSAAGLTDAAANLLDVSNTFIDSTQNVISANKQLIQQIENKLPKKTSTKETRDKASESSKDTSTSLSELRTKLAELLSSEDSTYEAFVTYDRDSWKSRVDNLQSNASSHAQALNNAGYTALGDEFTKLASNLGDISADLDALTTDMSGDERTAAIQTIIDDIDAANKIIEDIGALVKADISGDLANALAEARQTITSFRTNITNAGSKLSSLQNLLSKYNSSLGKLQDSIDRTTDVLDSVQSGADSVSGILSNAAGNELLQLLSGMLANDETAVAEYLSNPVKMDTEVIWPVENYGSAMAPFYTVLAQWVGALLTAVLIKVKVKKRKDLVGLRMHEWYFGRYGLYMLVGIVQALVVSAGDLLYVHIQCQHPLLFVLEACVNGIVFMMINYALVFALDNIGLGAAVIILVLQVAGSGGTYPVEVLPDAFKVIYPFMPFRYAMNAMRECICGMYDGTYWQCLGVLGLFFLFAVAFGMALYRPMRWLNDMIAASKAKSEIML